MSTIRELITIWNNNRSIPIVINDEALINATTEDCLMIIDIKENVFLSGITVCTDLFNDEFERYIIPEDYPNIDNIALLLENQYHPLYSDMIDIKRLVPKKYSNYYGYKQPKEFARKVMNIAKEKHYNIKTIKRLVNILVDYDCQFEDCLKNYLNSSVSQ